MYTDSHSLERKELNMSNNPTSTCTKCGKTTPVVDLHSLPEVEQYRRAFAMSVKDDTPSPESPDEQALIEKYGFGHMALFCDDCLSELKQK